MEEAVGSCLRLKGEKEKCVCMCVCVCVCVCACVCVYVCVCVLWVQTSMSSPLEDSIVPSQCEYCSASTN